MYNMGQAESSQGDLYRGGTHTIIIELHLQITWFNCIIKCEYYFHINTRKNDTRIEGRVLG